jgi:chromosome transmission fidelity protein 1
LGVLQGLVKVCEGFLSGGSGGGRDNQETGKTTADKGKAQEIAKGKRGQKSEMVDANTLMGRLGGGGDQVNLMELVAYLKESKLARKVSGFAEQLQEDANLKGESDIFKVYLYWRY